MIKIIKNHKTDKGEKYYDETNQTDEKMDCTTVRICNDADDDGM